MDFNRILHLENDPPHELPGVLIASDWEMEKINVSWDQEDVSFQLINISGQVVAEKSSVADGKWTIDTHNLKPGLYFLLLENKYGSGGVRKVMILK